MCSIQEIVTNSNILLNLPGAVLITDIQGKILFANKMFCDITEYASDELIGQKPSILKSGFHDEHFYKAMWEILMSGGEYSNDLVNKRKDGSFYTSHLSIKPFRNTMKSGSPIENFIAISTDITHQKRIENKWRAIINGLPNIIVAIFDENRVCIELYPETVDKTFPNMAMLKGKKLDEIGKGTNLCPSVFEQHEKNMDFIDNGLVQSESTYYTKAELKDGSLKDAIFDTTYSRYNHNKYIVVIRDVTDSRPNELRQTLLDSVEQLKMVESSNDQRGN